jgi:hypothetical protein
VLEKICHLLPALTQLERQRLTVEDAGDCRIGPDRLLRPVSFCRKRCEEPPVDGAAKRDRPVGDHEDVAPERIGGPEGLHRRDVRAQAGLDHVARGAGSMDGGRRRNRRAER